MVWGTFPTPPTSSSKGESPWYPPIQPHTIERLPNCKGYDRRNIYHLKKDLVFMAKTIFNIIASNPASILIVLGFFLLFSGSTLGAGGTILGLIMIGLGFVAHLLWLARWNNDNLARSGNGSNKKYYRFFCTSCRIVCCITSNLHHRAKSTICFRLLDNHCTNIPTLSDKRSIKRKIRTIKVIPTFFTVGFRGMWKIKSNLRLKKCQNNWTNH